MVVVIEGEPEVIVSCEMVTTALVAPMAPVAGLSEPDTMRSLVLDGE